MSDIALPGAKVRQLRLAGAILAVLIVVLAAGYYLFLRTEYAVLYSALRPADASAIVAELEAKGVSYKLRDQGTTILVPEAEADGVRLAVISSDGPMKGVPGFELFNKSDMGLTDFAQKINYQRALQGELSRTIMLMDGIESARVHLAIPERSLFRGKRSDPKAAVTIAPRRGRVVDEARVGGIQRLVAAAVSDLALSDVVVLDEAGRVISAAAPAEPSLAPDVAEKTAATQYYQARIRSAVQNVLPGLKFEPRVVIMPFSEGMAEGDPLMGPVARGPTQSRSAGSRNFRLRVLMVTESALDVEEQMRVGAAVTDAVGLNRDSGDDLSFAVDTLGAPAARPAAPRIATSAEAGSSALAKPPVAPGTSQAWLIGLAAMLTLLLAVAAARARRPAMSPAQRDLLVARVRRQLSISQEVSDGGA
jgi:flagellar M-ring protein FliF